MIMAKPAHTTPSTRALKLRGVPSPMPLFSRTPQANHMAEERFRASSSSMDPSPWFTYTTPCYTIMLYHNNILCHHIIPFKSWINQRSLVLLWWHPLLKQVCFMCYMKHCIDRVLLFMMCVTLNRPKGLNRSRR